MEGEVLVHIHCYRADEMAIMLDLSKEFGFKIAAFHHAVEAYKIADLLAENGVCGAEWADWWGFKMETFDGIQENIALTDLPQGGCAIVHSDSDEGIQRLNQEAAKAMARGARVGLGIPPERAIRWLTANPAKALGIDQVTGTLEAGKMGDVVIWNGTPFSVYALAEQVFIDGVLAFDRANPPQSRARISCSVSLVRERSHETPFCSPLLSCAALANAQDVLIRGATVHTVSEQGTLTNTDVLVRGGKIAAVGTGLSAPAGGDRRCQGSRADAGHVRRPVGNRHRGSQPRIHH